MFVDRVENEIALSSQLKQRGFALKSVQRIA